MGQVFTEDTNIASSEEAAGSLGVIPTAAWRQHQPTVITKFGNVIKKIARDIISSNRQREKGEAADADSGVELEFDLTKDSLDRDCVHIFKSVEKFSGGTGAGRFCATLSAPGVILLSAVAAGAFTVASLGALQQNTLVYMRGFTNAANNGLQPVAAASTATSIKVTAAVLEAAPPSNATLEVAGFRGAVGDIGLDVNGNLTSTVADFTTMGLFVGQNIWVGGTIGGANAFANAAYRGWVQIATIAAHLVTFKRRAWTVGAADPGTGKLIDIYFGSFIRNVGSQHADYLTPSRTVELTLPKLGAAGATEWWYSRGCMLHSYKISVPAGDKITVQAQFIGTITDDPVTVEATGAATAMVPTPGSFNMIVASSDVARLRVENVDETGISTDFKTVDIMINSNISAEKQIGTFGAAKMNVGGFDVDIDAEMILGSDDVIKSVRDNRSCALGFGFRNGDMGGFFDVPTLQVNDAPPDLVRNQSVRIKGKLSGVRDQALNYTLSLSRMPFCPAS